MIWRYNLQNLCVKKKKTSNRGGKKACTACEPCSVLHITMFTTLEDLFAVWKEKKKNHYINKALGLNTTQPHSRYSFYIMAYFEEFTILKSKLGPSPQQCYRLHSSIIPAIVSQSCFICGRSYLFPKKINALWTFLLLPSAIVTLCFLCRAILKLSLTDAETRAETETTHYPLMKWHSIYFENSISTKPGSS